MMLNDEGRCICCDHAADCLVHQDFPSSVTCTCSRDDLRGGGPIPPDSVEVGEG